MKKLSFKFLFVDLLVSEKPVHISSSHDSSDQPCDQPCDKLKAKVIFSYTADMMMRLASKKVTLFVSSPWKQDKMNGGW